MLTRNEIRTRLTAFAKEWAGAAREHADAKLFWARLYECFGIRPESATIYEKAVSRIGGGRGFIDSFIPGKLIVEHKSRGGDLDSAFVQASDYFMALSEKERPKYIVTSDFSRFRLYDLKSGKVHECTLSQLPRRADWFYFLVSDEQQEITEESKIDRQAAYRVSKLHQFLLESRFKGHDLEVFMTRLLFCFFADDTGIFGRNGQFLRFIRGSSEDGRDSGSKLSELFQVLDTPHVDRLSNIGDELAAFEYINGSLFSEKSSIPSFDGELRALLLSCAELDWSAISPAIFGAMFQGILDQHDPFVARRQATRRELGAHYTSERNILKVINPLIMEDLWDELRSPRATKATYRALYEKLPTINLLDPACGCGNFLVIAYRQLRRLEMELISLLWGDQRGVLDVSTLCRVNVSQFFGIELDEAAAHIARVALWITDHQMNLEAAERFGTTRPSVPLIASPTIFIGNALTTDWASIIDPVKCSYVLGNPPFVGAKYLTDKQREDVKDIYSELPNGGLLDYVAAWYLKAMHFMEQNRRVRTAFVSTNSICQGEQAGVLWPYLLEKGVQIEFAHQSFRWSNEGKGIAAVHCIIAGFSLDTPRKRVIYLYPSGISGEATISLAKNINGYLVDAPNTVIKRRNTTISGLPEMSIGNKPIDGGNYLFTTEEKHQFLSAEPAAAEYFKRWLGADEFLNGYERWCLLVNDIEPSELRSLPHVLERVTAVRKFRLESRSAATRKLADTPRKFHVEFKPKGSYLAIPEVSSEKREYIPIGYLDENTLASNLLRVLPEAGLFEFGILSSSMHNAWMRTVAGRMKSDYRYSINIVYNNFPLPLSAPIETRSEIEDAAQRVLDARQVHSGSTLADLYNREAMPDDVRNAHNALNRSVDAYYRYRGDKSDSARVSFLFNLYSTLS